MKETLSSPEQEEKPIEHEENIAVLPRTFSRRSFLKVAGITLAGLATGASIPVVYEKAWNALDKEGMEKEIEELENELTKKYGIDVKVWDRNLQDRPTGIIKDGLKEHSLYRAYKSLLTLKRGLTAYPVNLIKQNISGIEIVYSVKQGYGSDVPEEVTPEAVTSFGGNITIRAGYQSAVSYKSMFGDNLDLNVLHHEIAHTLTDEIKDDDWKNLHPGVKYVGNNWVKIKDKKPQGFAMPYGAKSLREDIATIAELLFADIDELESAIANDDILRKKVEYLKNYYEKKGGGLINTNSL